MNKKLLLTLLVCSVSALHTASHGDFTKFQNALSAYRANKSAQNLDALLDVYETLTLDIKRPEWANMARNEAIHFGINIDKLAAAEEPAPVVQPAAPVRSVAPVAPVRQPARAVAPPPAPSPVAPRRPAAQPTAAPVRPKAPVSVQQPVVTRPTTAPTQKPPVQQPISTLTDEEMEAEIVKKYGTQAPAQEKKAVQFAEQPEIRMFEQEEEEEPVQVIECGPQAPTPDEEAEEELPDLFPSVAQQAEQTFEPTPSYSAEEVMRPYTQDLTQKLNRVRGLVKAAQERKVTDADLTLYLKDIDPAFQEIRSQLNAHDYTNLQQDIGDLHKKVDLARLKPAAVEQPAQKSSWFPFGRKQVSPADAELTMIATRIHDVRSDIVALKDKPELPMMLREQLKRFNALKAEFPADEKRVVQIALDVRYINDYLNHEDKALADKNEADVKELDKNLKKLADLDKKFDQSKSRKASDQKQFVELYGTIKNALDKDLIPSSNAEQWQGLMNDKFFMTYRILIGQTQPTFAPASFGK